MKHKTINFVLPFEVDRKDYIFPKYLCKNTAELMEEETIVKASIPEAYLEPCQLSMLDSLRKL